MSNEGLRDEFGSHAELDRLVVPGAVADPGLLELLDQIGGVHLDHLSA